MSNSISRIVGSGRTFLSPTDLFVQANTNDSGQVEIVLPNSQLIFDNFNNQNTPYNYLGVRIVDIGNNASVNNIVIFAFDNDNVNGGQTITLNTNGAGGIITLIGEGQWIFDENNSVTSNPIIQQGTGLGSSVRIDSNNTSSGSYSTALGKTNCVDSIGGFVNGSCNTASGYKSNDIVGGCCNTSGTPNFIFPNNCVTQSGLYFEYCFTFPNNCVTQSGLYFDTFSAYANVVDIANDGSSITLSGDYSSCSTYLPATAIGIQAFYDNGTCSTYAQQGICGSSLSCIDYDGTNTTFCYNPPIPLPFVVINSFSAYANVVDIANDGSSITLSGDYSSCSTYLPATAIGIYATFDNGTCSTYAQQGICGNSLSCIDYDGTNTTFCYNPSIPLPFVAQGSCFSTILNGQCNTASGYFSTVSNGICNTASSQFSTVLNGSQNTASGYYSTVSNGYNNTASGGSSTVLNGSQNTASSQFSTVLNGFCNTASGNRSTVLNGQYNTASGSFSTVSNGCCNTASGCQSTINNGCCNTASAKYSTVSNGYVNTASAVLSTVSNGQYNTASAVLSTVSNGQYNTASGIFSTVSNGCCNIASGCQSTINNGCCNTASGCRSTVSNGLNNTASGYYSTVLNGSQNTASGYVFSTVLNGTCNTASGCYSTVSNGCSNTASGCRSFIAGGQSNNTCSLADTFIVGSCICADASCTTFVNKLSIKNIPTSNVGLPSGSVWYDSVNDKLTIVP
jgi:hypothetical protein